MNAALSRVLISPKLFPLNFLPALAVALCLLGCASLPSPGPSSAKAKAELRARITGLSERVQEEEASRLAETAVDEAIHLARQYGAVRPAWFHNVLVNHGLRERGLCFQWANDLFEKLYPLGLVSLDLQLAVSYMDTPHEHNVIVVTAHGQPFETGIVLDAWRYSGRLWSCPVAADAKYHWTPLPADRIDPEIRKLLRMPPEDQESSALAGGGQ